MGSTSTRVRTRSWTSTASERSAATAGSPRVRNGVARSMNSSVLSARIFSALTNESFFWSKKAGAALTSSSRYCSTISVMGRTSTPSAGPQPSRAR